MLDRLRKYEEELLRTVPTGFYRYLYDTLKTHDRLIGLVGTSGMGKSTLLLQRTLALREEHGSEKVLYLTLDYPFLSNMDLVAFAEELHTKGVRYLLIDELHRHPHFRQTLKTIYDKVMGMQIIFAGSAGMDTGGLGARLTLHRLQGLSFREVMSIGRDDPLPHFTLSEILSDHTLIAKELYPYKKVLCICREDINNVSPYLKDSRTEVILAPLITEGDELPYYLIPFNLFSNGKP